MSICYKFIFKLVTHSHTHTHARAHSRTPFPPLITPECNIEVHSKGRLKGNMCVPIENCVQCEFQQATKKCKQCVDLYCDTCYYDQHKRGQLLKHDFTPINDHCVDCEKFVAMLLIEPTNECICKKCYKKRYPHDKTFTNPGKPGLSVKPHEHIPNAVDEYYESLKMDEEKRLIQIEFEERKVSERAGL